MTHLQKIVAEAKKIRKAHPKKYAKWTDYIKAASKKIKPVKKIGAVKRKTTKSQHKDTKSHNVNVKVVSGIEPHKAKYYIKWTNELGYLETEYFDKYPKYYYWYMGKELTVMRPTNKGTAIIPVYSVKTNKIVTKK